MTQQPKTATHVFVGYALDIFLPIVTYLICNALGVPPLWGMIGGAAIALASTLRNTLRNRKLDRLGAIVIAEIVASIVLLFVSGSPRILLSKPALYTLIAGVYLIATSFRGKPINYEGVKGMAARGDAVRGEAFDRVWDNSPEFQRAIRISAVGWGFALIVDSILRVVVIYSVPVERAMVLGYIPHLAAMVILIGFSALMGKTTERIMNSQFPDKKSDTGSAASADGPN